MHTSRIPPSEPIFLVLFIYFFFLNANHVRAWLQKTDPRDSKICPDENLQYVYIRMHARCSCVIS